MSHLGNDYWYDYLRDRNPQLEFKEQEMRDHIEEMRLQEPDPEHYL